MGTVGYRTGLEQDSHRLDWDGKGARPLAWSAWYPSRTNAKSSAQPIPQMFHFEDVVCDGELAEDATFPVILLSHGTGGSPESLGWLAHSLAQSGFVVIGAHHHGNTGREPYRAEGFLCWWERAADLSALLTKLSQTGPFADRLALDRAHALGFSLGGYAALSLAGARTSVDRFLTWADETGVSDFGPREFPNLAVEFADLRRNSPSFRASWDRQGENYRDDRLRTFTAIAPAPCVQGFDKGSLLSIDRPVTLIAGEADMEAPSPHCADWLVSINPTFKRVSMGEQVGHYTFLGHPVGEVVVETEFLFRDNPGVDRSQVHEAVLEVVLSQVAAD